MTKKGQIFFQEKNRVTPMDQLPIRVTPTLVMPLKTLVK